MSRLTILLLLLPVFVDAVLVELRECAPSLAARLLRRAVRHLPEPDRERYREEWTALLDDVPGKFTKLATAIGFQLYAPFAGRAARGRPSISGALLERIKRTAHFFHTRRSPESVFLARLLLSLAIIASVMVAAWPGSFRIMIVLLIRFGPVVWSWSTVVSSPP